MPDGLEPVVAAALPTRGTGLALVDSLKPLRGRTVLIVRAGGGVGSFATQSPRRPVRVWGVGGAGEGSRRGGHAASGINLRLSECGRAGVNNHTFGVGKRSLFGALVAANIPFGPIIPTSKEGQSLCFNRAACLS